jgi:WS/DGAT/MGAT family acyltransferase
VDRLTPLAATFLEAEDVDDTASLAIGSFSVFDGPAPPFEDFLTTIAGRLPLIPRFRQRVRRVPLDLAAPAWEDDPSFDLRWHVRNTALPAPGGPEEISRLMSRVMTRRMDRSRPLWEYWFCEGLAGGRWGLLSKLHHSMVDGVSATDVSYLVLDPTPEPRPPVPDLWEPASPASAVVFTATAAAELVASPARAAGQLVRAARRPLSLLTSTLASARGLLALSGAARPLHGSSLTGRLDGSRRYAYATTTLSALAGVRRHFGVSVNDVALAAVTGGFRALLESRGEVADEHAVRTLVPVSTHVPGEASTPDNRVSLMLPYLPVDLADPADRLTAVHERIRTLRAQHEPQAGTALTTMAEQGPFAPVVWGIRMGIRLPQRQVATVTTNVPGPRQTFYALGRELQQVLPYVPIADQVRLGVAMVSYRDDLVVGLTADYDTAADLDVLATGITRSLQELIALAPSTSPTG